MPKKTLFYLILPKKWPRWPGFFNISIVLKAVQLSFSKKDATFLTEFLQSKLSLAVSKMQSMAKYGKVWQSLLCILDSV